MRDLIRPVVFVNLDKAVASCESATRPTWRCSLGVLGGVSFTGIGECRGNWGGI